MKTGIKKKWIKALRSREYVQGQGQLCMRRGNTEFFCCLGVLCDVLARGSKDRGWEHENSLGELMFEGQVSDLSRELLREVGLTDKQEGKLIKMNDSDSKTFEQIADFIETKL